MPLKQTIRALQVLRDVNRALENANDDRQLLDEVCRIVHEVGGYRFCWAGYVSHDAEHTVRFMAHAGHHPDYLKQIRINWDHSRSGGGPAGQAIRSLKPSVVQHIASSEEFTPWRERALAFGYQSVIALPLSWRGEAIGCLAILSGEPEAFNSGEAELLNEVAAVLSYGINALRTRDAHELMAQTLRTERDSQAILRQILSLSLEPTPLEEKLEQTLELLFNIPWLSLEHNGSVFLADSASRTLRLVAKRHLTPVLQTLCGEVAYGHCLCGRAAASGELVFRNHVDETHETRYDGIQDHGHYCQPIRSSNGLLGVLNLYVAAGHECTPEEVQFLGAVADTLAVIIEREHTESAQRRLVTLLEATPDMVAITDTDGRCLYCNDRAQQLLGIERGCLQCDHNIFAHYAPEVAQELRENAYPMAMAAGLWEGELELLSVSGERMPTSLLIMSHRDSHGKVAYLSTTARDISDRIRAEQAAQAAAIREHQFANSLINSLPGIFYLVDEEGRLIRWNSNMEQLLGYDSEWLAQQPLSSLVTAEDWPRMQQTCSTIIECGSASIELAFSASDGSTRPFYLTGTLIEHDETGRAIAGIGIDISYRKKLEQELRQMATTDALTGAYNRLRMEEVLEQELKRAERYGSQLSLAMFDVDHFKRVNDNHGHDCGDTVLKTVVTLARDSLRDVDMLARWGGEEFMIISPETTLEQMQALAERIRRTIEQHRSDDGIGVTASFGLGQYRPGESQKQLLKRVDDALYAAKNGGRNQLQVAS